MTVDIPYNVTILYLITNSNKLGAVVAVIVYNIL